MAVGRRAREKAGGSRPYSKGDFKPFERTILGMAYEGWYGVWELPLFLLSAVRPNLNPSQRRELAANTLSRLVDEGLVDVVRRHFTKQKWATFTAQEGLALLSNDVSWLPRDVDQWQVHFRTTEKGNALCDAVLRMPPRARGGWMPTTWWIPKSHRADRAPTTPWVRNHIRKYIDREQTVFSFWWPLEAFRRYYPRGGDDLKDRRRTFCTSATQSFWSSNRRGDGDDERLYRSQVGSWLAAFRMSPVEWRNHIRGREHPVGFWNLWLDEDSW
jgi:hypothetical protein